MIEGNDAERAYAAIREGIVEGRFAPGARLVEQRVAEELDMSRTPIREAVRRLESEGLVIVERNRGAQVRSLSRPDIADLYDVRARLEGYGASLAAARHAPDDIVVLRDAAAAFDAAVSTATRSPANRRVDAVRDLDAANGALHGALLAASRHKRIQILVAGAIDAPLVFQALQRFVPAELERSSVFHHLIVDAVAAAASDRAERLMVEHVLQGRDVLLQRLSDAGDVAHLFGPVGA